MRSSVRGIVMVMPVLLSTGCAGPTTFGRALGADPSSTCVSVGTLYRKGAGCRTANGAERTRPDGLFSVTWD